MFSTNTFHKLLFIHATLVTLWLLVESAPAYGAVAEWRTGVRAVLSGDSYGSCMVQVDTMPYDRIDCPGSDAVGNWLSLDCDGNYRSPTIGRESLDISTIAMLTNSEISVRVNDRERNGYCVASQVILWRD